MEEGGEVMGKMNKPVEEVYWEAWSSPFGEVTVLCSEKGLRRVHLGKLPGMTGGNGFRGKQKGDRMPANLALTRAGNRKRPGARLARQAVAELREYAAGRRKRFTVPLDLDGTPFQLKVWNALLRIPYGETRSYQQIAQQVGHPRASRAVGMANHFNPVAIIVPCHRVIASDGSLGGYGGGLENKSEMLRLEGAVVAVK